MQLMIDIATETPAALRLAASFFADHAALMENEESKAALIRSVAPSVPSNVVPFPPPVPPVVPVAVNPAQFTPNVQTAPIAPPVPTAIPPASTLVPVVPAAPVNTTIQNNASPATIMTGGIFELDSAGMPWDARIHQKLKSKKKDGTWKLQKGIADNIVAAVTQEIHVYLLTHPELRAPQTSVTAGAAAPVSLPPVPIGIQAPAAPPAPQNYEFQGQIQAPPVREETHAEAAQRAWADHQKRQTEGQIPVPAIPQPVPQASVSLPPPVPLSPAANVGVPNSGQPGVLSPPEAYRALVSKIAVARNSGRITAEQVTSIVMQAGVTNLQLLGSMLHLVPNVDALVDAVLATA